MSIDKDLQKRSNNICELCGSSDANTAYSIPNSPSNKLEHCI